MYRLHSSTLTVLQNRRIHRISSSLLLGFTSRRIRALGGRPPPIDVVLFEEFVGMMRCVLRVVVLHKTMTLRVYTFNEWNQALCKNIGIQLNIHDPFENAYFSAAFPTYSGPNMNFGGFGRGL